MKPTPAFYATTDDNAKLPVYIHGEGETVFVFNGFTCVQENLKYVIEALSQNYRVVSWDYRGHGLSERSSAATNPDKANVDRFMKDALSVFEQSNTESAHILGYSMGAQFGLEFANRHPERIQKIICLNGIYGKVFDNFLGTDLLGKILPGLPHEVPILNRALNLLWKTVHSVPFEIKYQIATIALLDRGLAKPDEVKPFLEQMSSLEAEFLLALAKQIHEHETFSFLNKIEQPALVIAGSNDLFATAKVAQKVASELPKSKLYIINKGTHNSNLERASEIFPAVQQFLTGS